MAPSDLLDAAYITKCEHDARRFSGCWDQGTSGTLAAHTMRLLKERQQLLNTVHELESANEALRSAVTSRLAGCKPAQEAADACLSCPPSNPEPEPETKIPVDWILQGEREWKARQSAAPEPRLTGDGVMHADDLRPGSKEFLAVLDELRSLHLAKTLDYGVDEDALSNIRSSADIVNMPAWAGCVLRMMDKMHRLKAYFRRGKCEFDGLSDTLKDIACYAVIAEVLRRESGTP